MSKKPFLVVELGELVKLVERRQPNRRILLSVVQCALSQCSTYTTRTRRVLADLRQYHARSSTVLQPLLAQSSLVSIPLHYESIFNAQSSFLFFSALERVVQFSRSLRGRHSTALRRSSANALSPLHQVTVYARAQHIHYSTISRWRLHRCSVVIPSPLDRDPTVYFSMLGRVMIYSNMYNVLFNRLKAFLDCSVFTFHHSDDYNMFQNLFTQCIVLFTYLQSNSNEYPSSENTPGAFPIYASEQ